MTGFKKLLEASLSELDERAKEFEAFSRTKEHSQFDVEEKAMFMTLANAIQTYASVLTTCLVHERFKKEKKNDA